MSLFARASAQDLIVLFCEKLRFGGRWALVLRRDAIGVLLRQALPDRTGGHCPQT
jgi:hypothetical protein